MSDTIGVDVVQSFGELLRDFPDFCLFDGLVIFDQVEEFSLSEFGDEDELGGSFKGIEEKDYVLVFEFFEDLDFLAHGFKVLVLLALLFDGFDRHRLPRVFSSCLVYIPISALPDQRNYVVIIFLALRHPV